MAVQFAGRLAMIAFATAAVRGAIADADFTAALQAALAAAAAFYGLGLVFGELARRIVEESVEAEFRRTAEPAGPGPAGRP